VEGSGEPDALEVGGLLLPLLEEQPGSGIYRADARVASATSRVNRIATRYGRQVVEGRGDLLAVVEQHA
jgi:hypothetical protein